MRLGERTIAATCPEGCLITGKGQLQEVSWEPNEGLLFLQCPLGCTVYYSEKTGEFRVVGGYCRKLKEKEPNKSESGLFKNDVTPIE